jgi:hypothetical protein
MVATIRYEPASGKTGRGEYLRLIAEVTTSQIPSK